MAERFSRRVALATGASVAGGLLLGSEAFGMERKRTVVVWSEGTAVKDAPKVYPKDINTAVAEGLKPLKGWDVVTASLSDPDQGVPEKLLNRTDVLIWWGHKKHNDVKDDLVDRIVSRVKEKGMGFIALHSSHFAKALKKLLGTRCGWKAYVVDGSSLKVIVKEKDHPIAKGVKDFALDKTERYTEPFQVPPPEVVVFDGVYMRPDGSTENSRQGLVWTIGKGKVFYFQPGHETYPHFHDANVQQILRNAVAWMAPA